MGANACCASQVAPQSDATVNSLPALQAMQEEPITRKVQEPVEPPPVVKPNTEEDKPQLNSNEFIVTLTKQEGAERLGIDVDLTHGALLVEKVDGGLMGDWNRANPDRAVKKGDKVIAVNGVRYDPKAMTAQCRQSNDLELLVQKGP
mmetsp:Transcript_13321/g.31275  ORF Transcript_13321/g.31275 Transcript_13321/m.31275 type:complete len:147 (+) Transcript_13321:82-522(+)|eukprot:CAMPEP_0171091530 /NCGR_PEP_ID=MMETSP0766_2-20121228/33872_1 /TAXON_ID=439317 /ORGANISM="Gambierdiscus australes, Strain CAWD 149" /LENGTH=146 /DNA_ID=CAMNT_0011549645 /DNA_START=76 /DNA_END=516 /DNA_ORIENTATION=-